MLFDEQEAMINCLLALIKTQGICSAYNYTHDIKSKYMSFNVNAFGDWRLSDVDWRLSERNWLLSEWDWRLSDVDWLLSEWDWLASEWDWLASGWDRALAVVNNWLFFAGNPEFRMDWRLFVVYWARFVVEIANSCWKREFVADSGDKKTAGIWACLAFYT